MPRNYTPAGLGMFLEYDPTGDFNPENMTAIKHYQLLEDIRGGVWEPGTRFVKRTRTGAIVARYILTYDRRLKRVDHAAPQSIRRNTRPR